MNSGIVGLSSNIAKLSVNTTASSDNAYSIYDRFFSTGSEITDIGSDSSMATALTGGVRFQGVRIPKNAIIKSAYITFMFGKWSEGNTVILKVSGDDADNSSTFTSYADITGRTLTTASVAWDNIPHTHEWTQTNSPELKTIIQEIVNRAGWASGNSLSIIIQNNGSTAYERARFVTYDGGAYGPAPVLHIELYGDPGPPLNPPTVFDRTVSAGTDDAYYDVDTTTFSTNLTTGGLGRDGDSQVSSIRFTNVTVPKNAVIENAYITFTAISNQSNGDCNVAIYGEDADNPATYSDYTDWYPRTLVAALTTAKATYDYVQYWYTDFEFNTKALTTIVQEIVNRAGWTSGNAMAFLFLDNADNWSGALAVRNYHTYDGSPTKAPRIHIEYHV
jgi:type IV pilus assembly protein PilY1